MIPNATNNNAPSTNARHDFLIDLANTFKAFLGLNFIVVAYGFSKAGLTRGIIGLIVITIITEHCCLLLIRVKDAMYQPLSATDLDTEQQQQQQQQGPTFGDVAFRVGGKHAERFIITCVILTQFGYCVGYFIFLSQTLHDLLASSSASASLFILIPLPILLSISLLKSIRSLGPFSAFANFALLLGFVTVVIFIIKHFNWTPTKVSLLSFPMFFGQMTAAIEGIGLVIPLEGSMRNKKNFGLILRITLYSLMGILLIVGVLGFATFGKDTKSIILLNFGSSSHVVIVVKIVLCIGILFTYPLQIIPVFEFAERLFLKNNNNGGNNNDVDLVTTTSRFRILDDDDDDDDDNNNKIEIDQEVSNDVIPESSQPNRVDIKQKEDETEKEFDGEEGILVRDKRRIGIRLGVVTLTAMTAVLAGSSFGVFNALVGSLGASMLAYTAPATFHNMAFGHNLSASVRIKNWVIAAFGVIGAIAGTFASVREIIEIHRGNSSPS